MGLDNPIHIAFLLILLLLVFGAKRLPEMGKSLGHGMRGFKDALSGESAGGEQHPSPAQASLVVPHEDAATAVQPQPVVQAVPVSLPVRDKLPA